MHETAERGRELIATRKIKKGEVVLQVRPLLAIPSDNNLQSRCSICLRPNSREIKLQSCDNCGYVVLCSSCESSEVHEMECSSIRLLLDPRSHVHHSLFKNRMDSTTGKQSRETSALRLLMRAATTSAISRRSSSNEDAPVSEVEAVADVVADTFDDFETLWNAEENLPERNWEHHMDIVKQTRYLTPPGARHSLETLLGFFNRMVANAFDIPSSAPQDPNPDIAAGALSPASSSSSASADPVADQSLDAKRGTRKRKKSVSSAVQGGPESDTCKRINQTESVKLSAEYKLSSTSAESAGTVVTVSGALFNHSCDPCVQWDFSDKSGFMVFTATRNVSKGARLEISYLNKHALAASTQIRRLKLEEDFFFICQCSRCAEQ